MPMKTETEVLTEKLHDSKVRYYAELMKRLFFQSKYVNLCKLCEEFLDELLDTLNQLVRKQKLALNENLDNNIKLTPVAEETEDEAGENNETGVFGKIMKIQEKLTQLENNDDAILERCSKSMKEAYGNYRRVGIENETLKGLVKEVKEKLSDMQNKENQSKTSPKDKQENYLELLKKFNSMEKCLQDFQSQIKSMNTLQNDPSEFERVRKLLTQANKRSLELETKLDKTERNLREKVTLTDCLTKKLIDAEAQISALIKEKDTVQSQKNAAEARLKVLQGTVKTGEKDKDRIATVMLQKDHYITKLEGEKRQAEDLLDQEKKTSSKKLEEINGSLKELTRMAKLKDNEIESLRNLCSEYQGESQKLVKSLIEKEKENNVLSLKYKELQTLHENKIKEFEDTLQQKVDENFANIMAYIEEKENEIVQLRKSLNEKELESNYLSEAEGRKLKDMEDVIYNLAKELREKEEENTGLKHFIEEYKKIMK